MPDASLSVSALLTIECKETAWKMICERYAWTHQGKAIEGKPELEKAAGAMAMAVMIARQIIQKYAVNKGYSITSAKMLQQTMSKTPHHNAPSNCCQ
jgi:hypothetical protein